MSAADGRTIARAGNPLANGRAGAVGGALEAGAFAVVLEMVPADVAKRVTAELTLARDAAEIVTDPELTRVPLENPGQVVKVLRGTKAEQLAALTKQSPPKRSTKAEAEILPKKPNRKKRPPKPSRSALDKAEEALQGLEKMRANLRLGLAQGLFVPQPRPNRDWLEALGTTIEAAEPRIAVRRLSWELRQPCESWRATSSRLDGRVLTASRMVTEAGLTSSTPQSSGASNRNGCHCSSWAIWWAAK